MMLQRVRHRRVYLLLLLICLICAHFCTNGVIAEEASKGAAPTGSTLTVAGAPPATDPNDIVSPLDAGVVVSPDESDTEEESKTEIPPADADAQPPASQSNSSPAPLANPQSNPLAGAAGATDLQPTSESVAPSGEAQEPPPAKEAAKETTTTTTTTATSVPPVQAPRLSGSTLDDGDAPTEEEVLSENQVAAPPKTQAAAPITTPAANTAATGAKSTTAESATSPPKKSLQTPKTKRRPSNQTKQGGGKPTPGTTAAATTAPTTPPASATAPSATLQPPPQTGESEQTDSKHEQANSEPAAPVDPTPAVDPTSAPLPLSTTAPAATSTAATSATGKQTPLKKKTITTKKSPRTAANPKPPAAKPTSTATGAPTKVPPALTAPIVEGSTKDASATTTVGGDSTQTNPSSDQTTQQSVVPDTSLPVDSSATPTSEDKPDPSLSQAGASTTDTKDGVADSSASGATTTVPSQQPSTENPGGNTQDPPPASTTVTIPVVTAPPQASSSSASTTKQQPSFRKHKGKEIKPKQSKRPPKKGAKSGETTTNQPSAKQKPPTPVVDKDPVLDEKEVGGTLDTNPPATPATTTPAATNDTPEDLPSSIEDDPVDPRSPIEEEKPASATGSQTIPPTPTPEPKPTPTSKTAPSLCEVSNGQTTLEAAVFKASFQIDGLGLKAKSKCLAPKYVVVEWTADSFDSMATGTAPCVHTQIVNADEIAKSTSTKNVVSITLENEALRLVQGLVYNARIRACASVATSQDDLADPKICRTLTMPTFKRASYATPLDSSFRFKLSTVPKAGSELRAILSPLSESEAANQISQTIIESLISTSSAMRTLKPERIYTRIEENPRVGDESVTIDILPPGPNDDPESMPAAMLAERVNCFLASLQAQPPASDSILNILSKVESILPFDPCGEDDTTVECARLKPAAVNPSTTPTTTATDVSTGVASTATPGFSDPDDEAEYSPPTPSPETQTATGFEVDDLNVGTSEIETKSVPLQQQEESAAWYESLGINPFMLMLLVGGVLSVTFYYLCMRPRHSVDLSGMGSDTSNSQLSADEDDEDDIELGQTSTDHNTNVPREIERGSKSFGGQKGFAKLSAVDDDMRSPSPQPGAPSQSPSTAGSFSNEKEEGSASKFLISILISIGIPSFGTTKYSQILRDNYLSTIAQLKQLDNSDWKRLAFPLVIEEALRKALGEHTAKEGKYASGGGGGAGSSSGGSEKRGKGLDLKAAASKKAGGSSSSSTKEKKKKGALSVSSLAVSPTSLSDVDAAGDEPALEAFDATPISSEKKSSHKSSEKKKIVAAAAPIDLFAQDEEEVNTSAPTKPAASSSAGGFDDDWLDNF